ncbi:MAG: hypothetical protein ACRYFU_25660, partial [Janthinobacterium lividum]
QRLLFTFRNNGGSAERPLAEVYIEELVVHNRSVAEDAYKRCWFGAEDDLPTLLKGLGFEEFDIHGVMSALKSHQDATRERTVNRDRLEESGCVPPPFVEALALKQA